MPGARILIIVTTKLIPDNNVPTPATCSDQIVINANIRTVPESPRKVDTLTTRYEQILQQTRDAMTSSAPKAVIQKLEIIQKGKAVVRNHLQRHNIIHQPSYQRHRHRKENHNDTMGAVKIWS